MQERRKKGKRRKKIEKITQLNLNVSVITTKCAIKKQYFQIRF